ncbi:MAG: MBL fold metallo-hydrolase [Anaerolineaceae bacterium]|nr:MBL fold metallo-hydrolase [Anaerolineaceae bacterium]
MHRERVSENVYWFQSDLFAQVTAGAIIGPQWAVLIDTLMPQETIQIRNYLESELLIPVRYIINTHHHADHCWGNCYFPKATIIGHNTCRKLMSEQSPSALAEAGKDNPFFRDVRIMPPSITFSEGSISIKVGKKQLSIWSTPGHSTDGISVLLEEDRIFFAGDAFMPIPYFVDGNFETLHDTIKSVGEMGLENIIQGHGDIILRGEIEDAVKSNLNYLRSVQKLVKSALRKRNGLEYLMHQDVEECGKSRVSLGGLAQQLHLRNLHWLYHVLIQEAANAG